MGVSKLTTIVIATNYPENIKCGAAIDETLKWAGFIYLTREGIIHSLQVSTGHVFDTNIDAVEKMHELCLEFVDVVKEGAL